jgi:hypothetical protein
MSRRPSAPPQRRALVRTSQRSRLEQQALVRAYELTLPVLRRPVPEQRPVQESPSSHTRRLSPQTRLGG